MNNKEILLLIGSVILLISFVSFGYYSLVISWNKDKQESTRQIIWLYNNLDLNQTKKDVENLFKIKNENNYLLDLYDIKNSNKMIVQTPNAFGATNWVLWIEFISDKIVSIKIRLDDSDRFKPEDSPPDKTLEKE